MSVKHCPNVPVYDCTQVTLRICWCGMCDGSPIVEWFDGDMGWQWSLAEDHDPCDEGAA